MLESSGSIGAPRLRREEYNRVWMLLEMFMESIIPLSMLVVAFGEPGTGKTTLARKIMTNAVSVWRNLNVVYLDPEAYNCHGLFAILQKALYLNGYSAAEILRILEESNHRFFIIIDNAESVVDDYTVKDFLKINEGFPHGGLFILMLFSSGAIPINILTVSPPSYFMRFSPYSPDEIRTILDASLNNIGVYADDKALDAISSFSRGDAKLALKILELALCLSGGGPIYESHVSEALGKISEDPFIHRFDRANDPHTKVILRILSQYPQGMRLKRLFEEYSRTCIIDGIRPLGYTQLWKRVRALEKRMLLDFRVVNLKGGRTGVVRAKCAGGRTSS